MKSLLAGLLLLGFVVNANATHNSYINNGDNTITETTSGLQWLALSQTANMTYSGALAANADWRYATNTEVNTMFADFFPSFVANRSSQYQYTTLASDIALATEFNTVFEGLGNYIAYGFYRDENTVLRMSGAYVSGTIAADLYGPDFANDYSSYDTVNKSSAFGSYLVKDASATPSVPEGTSLYLLAFGLLGLLAGARRKG